MSAHRPLLRSALLGAALLLLLAVVALASRTDRPSRPGDPEVRALPMAFWDYVVTVGILLIVGVVVLALFLRVPLPRPARRGPRGVSQLLGIVLICGLVALAGTRLERPRGQAEEENAVLQGQAEGERTRPAVEQRSPAGDRAAEIKWPLLFVSGGGVLVGLAVYAGRRMLRPPKQLSLSTASALSAALDESLDDLRGEPDSRRAVIAAYARMERTLEGHGLPRGRAEAPLEYLARVLHELRVRTSAVLALTELFERAKFSRHDIDAEMKEEAIGALVAVRDDLRGATA